MNIYEFIKLNDVEKGAAIWDGDFLAIRFSNEHRYALYPLRDFFMEFEYNPRKNKLILIGPFKTRKLLEPYVDRTDISGML